MNGIIDLPSSMRTLGLALAATAFCASAASAPVRVLFERDVDSAAGTEVFIGTYASHAAVLSHTLTSLEASALDVNAAFSIAGLTFNGSGYHMLFERNVDSGAGTELFVGTYASYADLVSNTLSSLEASAIDINPAFSVRGLTFDGAAYHVLFERDVDSGAGTELFVGTYASYADILTSTLAALDASAIDINPAFSVAGFDFDGSVYRILFERNADSGAGTELFVGVYGSLADVLASSLSSLDASSIDINPAFSVRGYATEWRAATPVPAPATGWLVLAAGLGALAACRRCPTM